MKAYIQHSKGTPININAATALIGFEAMGYEIVRPEQAPWAIKISPDDLVHGNINFVLKKLAAMGIEPPKTMEVPNCLNGYLGRITGFTTMKTIRKLSDHPVFIKPKGAHKLFDGHVVREFNNLIYTSHLPDDTYVLTSEVVKFVSEYRCFVLNGELVGCKHYKGNFMLFPDPKIIERAIYDHHLYANPPAAYSIDFGITDDGKTLLIELNDSYSLGCYGLAPHIYCQMIKARWEELTAKK